MKTNDVDMSEESQRELATEVLKQVAHRELAAGVLKQAAQDLRRYRGAATKVERELYFDAYRWVTADECASPFSFLNVCRLLNLTPDDVRDELVGDSSSGAFSSWIRSGGRAASRLRTSITNFFVDERNGHAEARNVVFNNAPYAVGAYLHETVS
jgi:hypothetical protein